MKSALSLTLIVCLVGSAIPLAAQERFVEPTSGPIARAVARESARIAQSAAGDAARQAGTLKDSDWSRVRRIAPGTEVTVTVRGSQAAKRYFVAANQSELTVLSLSHDQLPRAGADALRRTVVSHPEIFTGAGTRGTFVDGAVRLTPDGVFVGNQKVADLIEIVVRLARADVIDVATDQFHYKGLVITLAAVTAGVVILGSICSKDGWGSRCGG